MTLVSCHNFFRTVWYRSEASEEFKVSVLSVLVDDEWETETYFFNFISSGLPRTTWHDSYLVRFVLYAWSQINNEEVVI